MKRTATLHALQSIRTQFGLVSACMLLGLLLAFYIGGRYILVHMIREAEQNIQFVSTDIKSVVYGELGNVKNAVEKAAAAAAQEPFTLTNGILKTLIEPYANVTPINLAVALDANGNFLHGYYQIPGEPVVPVLPDEFNPYLSAASPLYTSLFSQQNASGLIVFRNKPTFFAVAHVIAPDQTTRAFVILGSLFHNAPLVSRINAITHGMQVSLSDKLYSPPAPDDHWPSRLAPVIRDALNYCSGGRWHLGDNAFEAVIPVNDILGKEVTSISIRMPGSFSSLARIALGWLTSFIATVGIVFVLPIFWLQTRIVLNPLTKLSEQIRTIGESHLDGDCEAIRWPHKDEFGVLAQSVNDMVSALAQKTRLNKQNEQRQRALIAAVPDCLCVFDTQAHVVTVHKQPDYAHPIPGLIPRQPVSPPIFPEVDCENLKKAVKDTFRTEQPQLAMLSCREADGTYRHFETRISRMDALYALVVFRDVTKEWRERENREQAEDRLSKIEKMESLSTLAAGIAHDFNNILTIIQNTVEITWESPAEDERDALATIRQATGKGAVLTRELMTYAGHHGTVFKREDPNTIVLDMEKLMGGVIAANVILELKLTPGLPHIDADPHQFWKVIINLLKNASEAMGGASGHIRISTYPLELDEYNINDFFSTHAITPGLGVVFQIDDTGSGISKDVINRMFEPFFSTKAVGRGLGLATVFGIVDAHNGGIAIASELGKGTSFRVWVPAASSAPDTPTPLPQKTATRVTTEAAAPTAPPAAAAPQTPRPSVLVVEDDLAILQATRIVLRSLKVEAITASSKREALSIFRKHADDISLILLDAQIGQLDNVRLLTTLRLRKPGVPAVIVSGHNESRIQQMFDSEPYDGFLNKPYTRDELKAVLSRFTTFK